MDFILNSNLANLYNLKLGLKDIQNSNSNNIEQEVQNNYNQTLYGNSNAQALLDTLDALAAINRSEIVNLSSETDKNEK